ncbi:MAG TPA: hypothetical protein VFZ76_06435 [Anaerolineales bacterium]
MSPAKSEFFKTPCVSVKLFALQPAPLVEPASFGWFRSATFADLHKMVVLLPSIGLAIRAKYELGPGSATASAFFADAGEEKERAKTVRGHNTDSTAHCFCSNP